MNRKEIKTKAKKLMKGQVWELFTPMLFIIIGQMLFSAIFEAALQPRRDDYVINFANTFLQMLIFTPLTVGYLVYLLNVVRKKKAELKQIFLPYNNMLTIVGVSFVGGLIVLGGTILFIIPGIIFALMYAMTEYLLADGETEVMKTLNRSKDLMNGYKWDYFVFNLSYIGWFLLVPFTLGIILIWLIPYVMLGQTFYYENLIKKRK